MLDRYVEATLAPRHMAAVSRHVKACDACAALVNELRVVDALMATTKAANLPPNFTFAVMSEVRATPVAVRRRLSLWSFLVFYLVAAWIALSGVFATLGGRAPWMTHAFASASAMTDEALAAITGVAHGIGPAGPVVVGVVSVVLVLDALLLGTVIFFYRSIRPRLVAALARSEAS